MRHAILLALLLAGCASSHQKMLAVERGLDAGSAALDVAVDITIERCRAKNLPTESERAACVAKVEHVNDVATPVIDLAVGALQTYWTAAAAADEGRQAQAIAGLKAAIASLPDEYFAGLKALTETLR